MSEHRIGPFARPDHPDFWKLAELVNQLDNATENEGRKFEEIVAEAIDPRSLSYVAMQRSMKVLGVTTLGQFAARKRELVGLATTYHEGFLVGVRFKKEES